MIFSELCISSGGSQKKTLIKKANTIAMPAGYGKEGRKSPYRSGKSSNFHFGKQKTTVANKILPIKILPSMVPKKSTMLINMKTKTDYKKEYAMKGCVFPKTN